jgi:formiminoglutamase
MQVTTIEKSTGRSVGIHFKCYDKQDLLYFTRIRRFETKLGERIQVVGDKSHLEETLRRSTARYVVFGIPEDIGIRANYGTGGADSGWIPFLSAFLNVQSNDFLIGDELLMLGHFDFGDLKYLIENASTPTAMRYIPSTRKWKAW